MQTIKFSTSWNHNFYAQTLNGKGEYGNYKFEIDNDCSECDFWIVWGGVKKKETAKCLGKNILYMTDEAYEERYFNTSFLNQFSQIITCRKDFKRMNIIPTHDLGIWHFPQTYDEVAKMTIPKKKKKISIVASNKSWLPGHRKRLEFTRRLASHFKDKISVYGRGINPIDSKFDALAPYEYSIAIENSFIPDYFTEKIFECFLTYTVPVYYGCPNIEKYFDSDAFIRIDINNYAESIKTVEEVIEEKTYASYVNRLDAARSKFLNTYHVFPALVNILENSKREVAKYQKNATTIYPESDFAGSGNILLRRVRNRIKRSFFNYFK